jgi:hypothetical protein
MISKKSSGSRLIRSGIKSPLSAANPLMTASSKLTFFVDLFVL